MRTRYFTPDEAAALVPEVRDRLIRIRTRTKELRELAEVLAALEDDGDGDGNMSERVQTSKWRELGALKSELREMVGEVTQLGIEVKDLESGLVDFPALKAGREVCLCWKLGESHVAHWHSVPAGFSGRQPVEPVPLGDWIWFS